MQEPGVDLWCEAEEVGLRTADVDGTEFSLKQKRVHGMCELYEI